VFAVAKLFYIVLCKDDYNTIDQNMFKTCRQQKQQAATAATLDRYCRSASCLRRVLQTKLLISWLYTREREREISSFEIPKSAPKLSMVFVGSITTVSLFHAMAEPGCVLVLLLLLWHEREGER
jgi:hypothetical protein